MCSRVNRESKKKLIIASEGNLEWGTLSYSSWIYISTKIGIGRSMSPPLSKEHPCRLGFSQVTGTWLAIPLPIFRVSHLWLIYKCIVHGGSLGSRPAFTFKSQVSAAYSNARYLKLLPWAKPSEYRVFTEATITLSQPDSEVASNQLHGHRLQQTHKQTHTHTQRSLLSSKPVGTVEAP